jgi:flagellar biosynthesis regulator FlbT
MFSIHARWVIPKLQLLLLVPLQSCPLRAMYLVAHRVLMAELAIDNVGEDFSVAVRMCAEASVWLHQVIVQHLRQA